MFRSWACNSLVLRFSGLGFGNLSRFDGLGLRIFGSLIGFQLYRAAHDNCQETLSSSLKLALAVANLVVLTAGQANMPSRQWGEIST